MKVSELVAILSEMPQDALVVIYDPMEAMSYGTPAAIAKMVQDRHGETWDSEQDAAANADLCNVDSDPDLAVTGELTEVVAIRMSEEP